MISRCKCVFMTTQYRLGKPVLLIFERFLHLMRYSYRIVKHSATPGLVMPFENEEQLIELAKSDGNAFALLYDYYVDVVYSFVLRRNHDEQLAQEITAVTFEKALKHLGRFQWQGFGLRPWLLRIARNELISHHRRQRFWSFLSLNYASNINLEWQFEQDEVRAQLHNALRRLKANDREVLTLRFFDELETVEIATVLGCSNDNVYLRLHRALKRLRQELEASNISDMKASDIEEGLHVWQRKAT